MGTAYDQSIENLKSLCAWYQTKEGPGSRNEATTRLHLIDCLLFECLGWDKTDCVAEERFEGQFTDYSLSAPHRLLIVEAKKEGIYFELPVGIKHLIYEIRFFERNYSQVYQAIKQAIEYCQSRGTPFGVVCNGHQLVAFLGSRTDGLPPLDGKALALNSLESMKEHSLKLWQCLSRPGIQAHNLAVLLQEGGSPPPPEKLSRRITNYPGFKDRNPIQTDLQILGDLLIEDVTKSTGEVEFLKNCFCESGALSQYALVSKNILKTRYSSLFEKAAAGPQLAPIVTKAGVTELDLADSLSRRPILLLGDVGVGKTIFIRHFIRVEAADLMTKAMVFYIDFGINPTLITNLRLYLARELARQLLDHYEVDIEEKNFVHGVYHGELLRFERGIYSDMRDSDPAEFKRKQIEFLEQRLRNEDGHLLASLEHLAKARKNQIVMFLDNIDQRPYEFQQEVFLMAQSLAETWPVIAYVSMRAETFYRSKSAGTLSAYHPKAFTISPPRADKVIQKRLEYALSLLETGQIPSLAGISVKLDALRDYLRTILQSFEENDRLMEFVDNVCGGNIRLALDFIRSFIGSGHVDTNKILGIYRDTGRYTIPLHEFLRAVIYGDHEYFDPRASELVNVFDISTVDGREHFLLLIILAQLDRWVQSGDAYVSQSTTFEFCQDHGFQPAQIHFALEGALSKKLIERHTKTVEAEEDRPSHYRVTSVGAYYYKRLAGMFAYVDAVIVDTPITDSAARARIYDVHTIQDRLDRAQVFSDYLTEVWKLATREGMAFDFGIVNAQLLKDIEHIRNRIG